MMKTTVSAIDFGTSKIVTMIAENSGSQRCDIISSGVAPYDGYLEGGWNNPGELDNAIGMSIDLAQKGCKRPIKEINVGVPGAFTKVYLAEVTVELGATDTTVKAKDVQEAFNRAREMLSDIPGIIIHSSPAWFMVDGNRKTLEPVGMKGRTMKALISFITASRFFVEEIQNRLGNRGITVQGFYATPAGEAMLYLPEEDRDHTAVLIDCGYLNTEVMIVEGDALLYHQNIEAGGGFIAAELAGQLDINLEAAELLKRDYVFSMASAETVYHTNTGTNGTSVTNFTHEEVAKIIEPIVNDMAEDILQAIEESGIKLGGWSNIYMTGGSLAMNRGGRDYLSHKLGRPVREVPKRTAKFNNHCYSSTLGLLDLIIETIEQKEQTNRTALSKVVQWFRGLLG